MVTVETFNALDQAGQIARLEALGRAALAEFDVAPIELSPLVHAENTTFRVDSPQGRFCLRISRPGYQTTANIQSEIAFLAALRAAGFRVPNPWHARLVTARVPEVPEARDCVLFGWMEGEFRKGPDRMTPPQAHLLGRTMAGFHRFAESWSAPEGFDRQVRDEWAFGPREATPLDEPTPMVSEENRQLLLRTDAMAREVLNSLPRDARQYGLIHADLHVGNLLFEGDHLNVIDFDDTGWGFWLYDFAAALAYESLRDDYPAVRDAMLAGYAEVRPLPEGTQELLPKFIQLRVLGISKWVLDRADNPMLREQGPAWIESFCEMIRRQEK